jgi:hypothetical protein
MGRPTRIMLEVCQACFGGDWQAMFRFARNYDPLAKERDVELGKRFRDIVGTRNRSDFWEAVAKCNRPSDAAATVVDGDSLCGMNRAIQLCSEGETVVITVNGKIIGKLIPEIRSSGNGKVETPKLTVQRS